jgi:hypothetical protein
MHYTSLTQRYRGLVYDLNGEEKRLQAAQKPKGAGTAAQNVGQTFYRNIDIYDWNLVLALWGRTSICGTARGQMHQAIACYVTSAALVAVLSVPRGQEAWQNVMRAVTHTTAPDTRRRHRLRYSAQN